jgi:hypothetical protein
MTIQIFIITIFTVIILGRVLFSKNYRIYYMLTAVLSIRLWLAILASIYFSTGGVYMQELYIYSDKSEFVLYAAFFMGMSYLFLEFIGMKLIVISYKKISTLPSKNIYTELSLPIAAAFFIINVYILWETYGAFFPGESSKFTYVNFTNFPYIYKALEPLSLFLLIVIAYFLSFNKVSRLKNNFYKIYLIYFFLIIGLILFSIKYMYVNAKSIYIVTILLYFIAPIYIFSKKYNIQFFKTRFLNYSVTIVFILLIILGYYFNYGESFLSRIIERLLLEGQLLYVSLEHFNNYTLNYLFIENIPNNSDNRAMVYVMEMFSPENKLKQFYDTGWQMSGSMPAYNFLFYDYWVGMLFWLFNWLFLIFCLSFGIRHFLYGNLIQSFIYLNISFLIAFFYLILGRNYLYSYRFWVLLFILVFIKIFFSVKHHMGTK